MAKNPLFENIPDEDLGGLLHQLLVVEGHSEVEINHPTEGQQILTKENYKELLSKLAKIKKLNPADQLIERKRIKRLKLNHQKKHRSQMITAHKFTVDLTDDENFGHDINGVKLDIDNMIFLPVEQYLNGVEREENEIGCFLDGSSKRPPIRIFKKGEADEE